MSNAQALISSAGLTLLLLFTARDNRPVHDPNIRAISVSQAEFSRYPSCSAPDGYTAFDGRSQPYGFWHLRISDEGVLEWNGFVIDYAELRLYLEDLSHRKGAGPVSLEIEPGAPCDGIRRAQSLIVASSLCQQGRCVENDWNRQPPIVN
jgi:hypothetical protein